MPKRTNGEGTIYQRKDGLWCGELTLGYEKIDGKSKRIKKSFSSKDREKLLQMMNEERGRLSRNIIVRNSDYTVIEWLEFWLENYKINFVRPKTYDNYESSIRLYVTDTIGKQKLNKLRTETIQQLYNKMHKDGYSETTIRILHTALSQAFEQAVKNELLYIKTVIGIHLCLMFI